MSERGQVIRIDRRLKRRRTELLRKKLNGTISNEEIQELAKLDETLHVGKSQTPATSICESSVFGDGISSDSTEPLKALLVGIRSRNKMSIKKMAELLNIPTMRLMDIENRREPFPAAMINDFAHIKEVSDNELAMLWRLCDDEEEA